MTCHRYEAALSEYVDGTLQASEEPADIALLDAVEAHLPECARCRALVEDLHRLCDAARTIEPHVPPAQLWTRIAQEARGGSRRQWRLPAIVPAVVRWQPLTAAALVLLMLGGSFVAWRQLNPAGPAVTGAPPAQRPAPDPGSPQRTPALWGGGPTLVQDVETELKLAEEHYVRAIAGLEAIAKAEGSELDPQTAEVLQANLTVIDAAIGESRSALRTEPSSDVARSSLFEGLRRKVTLLQETIALINEMRKGNQEGAARIVSELNR